MSEFMKHFIILSLVFLSLNLNTANSQVDHISRIDVVKSMNNYVDLTLSDFASDISYIPLETNSNCLIDQGAHFLDCGEFYLVGEGHQDLRRFDKTGKFLGIFAKYGRGPGEYSIISNIYFDEESQQIIVFDGISNKLLYYSIDGQYKLLVPIPIRPTSVHLISATHFMGELFHQQEVDSKHFSHFLFDTKGMVAPLFIEKVRSQAYDLMLAPSFFLDKKIAFVKPPACDTLYQIDQSFSMRKTFFELGKLQLPEKLLYDHAKFRKEFQRYIFNLMINPGYQDNLFTSFFYKGKAYVGICNLEQQSLKMINIEDRKDPTILNDLDGGLEFVPDSKKYNNSWYKLVWPSELKELLEEDRFLKRKIHNPEKRDQLKKFVDNLEDDDNPVIMVIKEKE